MMVPSDFRKIRQGRRLKVEALIDGELRACAEMGRDHARFLWKELGDDRKLTQQVLLSYSDSGWLVEYPTTEIIQVGPK